MLRVFLNNKKLRFVFFLLMLVNYMHADFCYREETHRKIKETAQVVFARRYGYVRVYINRKIQSIHSFIDTDSDIEFLRKALEEIEVFFKEYKEGMDDFGVHLFSEKEVAFFRQVRSFLKKEIKRVSKTPNDEWMDLVTIRDSSIE